MYIRLTANQGFWNGLDHTEVNTRLLNSNYRAAPPLNKFLESLKEAIVKRNLTHSTSAYSSLTFPPKDGVPAPFPLAMVCRPSGRRPGFKVSNVARWWILEKAMNCVSLPCVMDLRCF